MTASESPPPAPPAAAMPERHAGSTSNNDNVLAAVSYILLWITGLIILLTSKPFEKYKRWHAIQAIGLGVFFTAIQIALNILSAIFAVGGVWSLYSTLGGLVS